jgi:hypothetical protein
MISPKSTTNQCVFASFFFCANVSRPRTNEVLLDALLLATTCNIHEWQGGHKDYDDDDVILFFCLIVVVDS